MQRYRETYTGGASLQLRDRQKDQHESSKKQVRRAHAQLKGTDALETGRYERYWLSFLEKLCLDRHVLVADEEKLVHELLNPLGECVPGSEAQQGEASTLERANACMHRGPRVTDNRATGFVLFLELLRLNQRYSSEKLLELAQRHFSLNVQWVWCDDNLQRYPAERREFRRC